MTKSTVKIIQRRW